MSEVSVPKRQHVVNRAARQQEPAAEDRKPSADAIGAPVRPSRTPAGDAFTDLVLEVATLGGMFTARGEAFASLAGQSLARWVILDAIEDTPSTVAQVARRRGIARQAVQRVADLLEREGLVTYEPNPGHRRARLLRPTAEGRQALRTISIAQKAWADALGDDLGEADIRQALAHIERIRRAVADREAATPAARRAREAVTGRL